MNLFGNYSFGYIFVAIAVVHFIRRRPDNYWLWINAQFLTTQGKAAEARQWAQRILGKKATMPRYLKRRERPWFRRASALLKRLPA